MSILRALTTAQKWVLAIAALTLALAAGNLGRAVVAFHYAINLPELSTTVSLGYFAAVGGFWSAVFIACALGLSRFRAWGRWSTLVAVTLYQANVWVNRLLFNASDYARHATSRNLILTTILLLIFWAPLNLPAVTRAFDGSEERE